MSRQEKQIQEWQKKVLAGVAGSFDRLTQLWDRVGFSLSRAVSFAVECRNLVQTQGLYNLEACKTFTTVEKVLHRLPQGGPGYWPNPMYLIWLEWTPILLQRDYPDTDYYEAGKVNSDPFKSFGHEDIVPLEDVLGHGPGARFTCRGLPGTQYWVCPDKTFKEIENAIFMGKWEAPTLSNLTLDKETKAA